MPEVSAAVLRSTPSSTSASASIRRAPALSSSPLPALRSSEAVRPSRVIDTAAPIDAAPLKGQHRVRVSLIWESLMSHSFGPLVSDVTPALGPFLFAATPESDRDMPAVLTAAEMLTNAAEHGGPA